MRHYLAVLVEFHSLVEVDKSVIGDSISHRMCLDAARIVQLILVDPVELAADDRLAHLCVEIVV